MLPAFPSRLFPSIPPSHVYDSTIVLRSVSSPSASSAALRQPLAQCALSLDPHSPRGRVGARALAVLNSLLAGPDGDRTRVGSRPGGLGTAAHCLWRAGWTEGPAHWRRV